ncbi:MAG: hypothetical protein QNK37_08920 [Acidobacteriota bacterium]|nr:hypothetical protein [Acidobacteriota bacterium]
MAKKKVDLKDIKVTSFLTGDRAPRGGYNTQTCPPTVELWNCVATPIYC